jgi:hypothetical protein
MRSIELPQIFQRRLQATAQTPQRRGLFLDDFIVQEIDTSADAHFGTSFLHRAGATLAPRWGAEQAQQLIIELPT